MRPPFETFKGAICKGCYALGTACGTCEKCAWERAQITSRSTEEFIESLKAKVISAADLLTNLSQIIDVVKGEWAESWSQWDQEQRDAITAWLKAYYDEKWIPKS